MKCIVKSMSSSIFKKILITVVTLVFLMLLVSCGSSSNTNNGNGNDLNAITNLVNKRSFEIENQWAFPLSGSRIDLISNPNFMRVMGDSADVNLPYFGVRRMGGGYGERGGIIFNGAIKDVNVEQGKNGKSLVMKFNGSQGNENLQFIITMFPNNRTDISVNSSERDAISYQGHIKPYKEKEE